MIPELLTLLLVGTGLLLLSDAAVRIGSTAASAGSIRVLAGVVLVVGLLLTCLLVLGTFGLLHRGFFSLLVLGIFLVGRIVDNRSYLPSIGRRTTAMLRAEATGRRLPLLLFLICTVAVVAVRGLHAPDLDYDAVSYHLPYTVSVLDTGSSAPPDTPFGDNAQAYQPKNDDLLRVLLAPWPGCERLLWNSGFLHLPLLLLATYAAARACGFRRRPSLLGTLAVSWAPVVLKQAESAMVDLPFSSWWAAATALTIATCRPAQGSHRWQAGMPLVAGLALGLAYGTKFLAVPFTPHALLLFCVAVLASRRRLASTVAFLGGAATTGAYFYVRNLLLTGNPIFPIQVRIFGHDLLAGPYGRQEMLPWVFRTADFEPALLDFLVFTQPFAGTTVGGPLTHLDPRLALVLPVLTFLAALLLVRGKLRALLALVLVPLVPALCWYVIPYTYGRFALVTVLGFAVSVAAIAARPRLFQVACLVVVGQCLLTTPVSLAAPLYQALCLSCGIVLAGRLVPRAGTRRIGTVLVSVLCLAAILAVATAPVPTGNTAKDDPFARGRGLVQALPPDARVAYAGHNLPYLLRLPGGRSVRHIPVDGRTELRFHDRARLWARDNLPRALIPEPGFYRRHQDPERWLEALHDHGITHLHVTRVTDMQRLTIRHDEHGFPIEASWALAMTPAFHLLERDETSMVFAVVPGSEPRQMPATVERTEPDALALLGDEAAFRRHYPLAGAELARRDWLERPLYGRLLESVRTR